MSVEELGYYYNHPNMSAEDKSRIALYMMLNNVVLATQSAAGNIAGRIGGFFNKLFSASAHKVETVITYAFNSPNARHYAAKVTQRSVAKEVNTVIEPGVDVSKDIAAINAGKAVKSGNTFSINGRVYGYHDNVLYPISGEGFHTLDRGAYKTLGVYNTFGNTDRATTILNNMNMSQEARNAALKVWRAMQL